MQEKYWWIRWTWIGHLCNSLWWGRVWTSPFKWILRLACRPRSIIKQRQLIGLRRVERKRNRLILGRCGQLRSEDQLWTNQVSKDNSLYQISNICLKIWDNLLSKREICNHQPPVEDELCRASATSTHNQKLFSMWIPRMKKWRPVNCMKDWKIRLLEYQCSLQLCKRMKVLVLILGKMGKPNWRN